jgi:hypothetical protein
MMGARKVLEAWLWLFTEVNFTEAFSGTRVNALC